MARKKKVTKQDIYTFYMDYYLENGDLSYFMRSKIKPFQCPLAFKSEYQLFQQEYRERNYASATIVCNNSIVRKLLTFLQKKSQLVR